MNLSQLTAPHRDSPSEPMVYLADQDRLYGRVLDYGCGHGYDADYYGLDGYDPYLRPKKPKGKYDTITCMFVLNVLENEAEAVRVLTDIQSHLKRNGMAYIVVRNDKRALTGGPTEIGTYQQHVVLRLPVRRCQDGYVMYTLDNEDNLTPSVVAFFTY